MRLFVTEDVKVIFTDIQQDKGSPHSPRAKGREGSRPTDKKRHILSSE